MPSLLTVIFKVPKKLKQKNKLINSGNMMVTTSIFRATRSSLPEVFWKNVFLKISKNSQENTCVGVSFLNKVTSLIREMKFLRKPLNRKPLKPFKEWLRWLLLNNSYKAFLSQVTFFTFNIRLKNIINIQTWLINGLYRQYIRKNNP